MQFLCAVVLAALCLLCQVDRSFAASVGGVSGGTTFIVQANDIIDAQQEENDVQANEVEEIAKSCER